MRCVVSVPALRRLVTQRGKRPAGTDWLASALCTENEEGRERGIVRPYVQIVRGIKVDAEGDAEEEMNHLVWLPSETLLDKVHHGVLVLHLANGLAHVVGQGTWAADGDAHSTLLVLDLLAEEGGDCWPAGEHLDC